MSSRQILSLQPRESGGGGGRSNDDIVTELAEELEAQIPPPLEDEDAGATTFVVQVNKTISRVERQGTALSGSVRNTWV